ncbi:3'-5' exonuclease [Rhizobium sp. CC-YZS058]|uniref:3'-5' exonuclease n=1 Tax=Rhizobium sp. CC-YZS058 TaxID=3042153 RepID=UPI002B057BC0|nr:3'-5' exonuclease [Rhizobium sp. CC-YZS058]MEA3535856.1 3'-5' exonuclease [Rhizobium sp. CC-YZS058]
MSSVIGDTASEELLEAAARQLEASGRYRVLRRLDLAACLADRDSSPTRLGMFLDIECTGLDPLTCEPIELAILPFEYRLDGAIVAIHPPFQQVNQPSAPIPPNITKITGINDEMVSGHHIDPATVANFVEDAAIIIAHNAAFDRPIAERISPAFIAKPWACTMSDVDWKSEGFEGRRLGELLAAFGVFFDAHRALDDCEAGVGLLAQKVPCSGRRVLEMLLETARKPCWRIFAIDAPYDARELLRQRGYRWNASPEFGPKSWWIDLGMKEVEPELQFLENEIFHRPISLPMEEMTAYDRYSIPMTRRALRQADSREHLASSVRP